jgi:basic membrane lipoprotein Med (substrate-binding protein (PBP1-ABC) superfamily)
MSKEDVVNLMLESINADNRELCLKTGMSESDTESQIAQSQPSLQFILSNVYDKLKDANVIS